MINLIKNEYIKIFKKKGLYILLIIILGFTILTNGLYKLVDNIDNIIDDSSYIKSNYNDLKQEYENGNKDREFIKTYSSVKTDYDFLMYKEKFDKDSWQRFYITDVSDVKSQYSIINDYELLHEGTEEQYNAAKKELEEVEDKLNNSDWKDFVNDEIKMLKEENLLIDEAIKYKEENHSTEENNEKKDEEEIKTNDIISKEPDKSELYKMSSLTDLKTQKKLNELAIETCNTQLDNNISFSDKRYKTIISYTASAITVIRDENVDLNKLSDSEKSEYHAARELYYKNKYQYDNISKEVSYYNVDIFEVFYDNYLLMIVIFIFMISGPIVSQEFSKGTIKLLLVKPYSRTKILLSKFIVSISGILMAMVAMFILQTIVGGLFFGFDSLSVKIVSYSNISGNVHYYSIFKYFVLLSLSKLPQLIILSTLTFAVSTIFNNTAVSIIVGIVGYIGSNILGLLLSAIATTKSWAKLFVGLNWDFKAYIFNLRPGIKGLDFKFSLIVCIVHLLIMIIPAFIIFKRKDIKNV